eukprot:scaffold31_cov263-Pinguiococcus_pyrenoidosus.AAC.58
MAQVCIANSEGPKAQGKEKSRRGIPTGRTSRSLPGSPGSDGFGNQQMSGYESRSTLAAITLCHNNTIQTVSSICLAEEAGATWIHISTRVIRANLAFTTSS